MDRTIVHAQNLTSRVHKKFIASHVLKMDNFYNSKYKLHNKNNVLNLMDKYYRQ